VILEVCRAAFLTERTATETTSHWHSYLAILRFEARDLYQESHTLTSGSIDVMELLQLYLSSLVSSKEPAGQRIWDMFGIEATGLDLVEVRLHSFKLIRGNGLPSEAEDAFSKPATLAQI